MRVVNKYPIDIDKERTSRWEFQWPKWAQILCVQVQHEIPCLWVKYNTKDPKETRVVEVFGTGISLPAGLGQNYIGSFQLAGGAFVGHVFEINAP